MLGHGIMYTLTRGIQWRKDAVKGPASKVEKRQPVDSVNGGKVKGSDNSSTEALPSKSKTSVLLRRKKTVFEPG